MFTRVYWTPLTLADPPAALLLLVWPRTGLWPTLAIIASDVAHNLWFGARYHVRLNGMIILQCAFLVFVLVITIVPHDDMRTLVQGMSLATTRRRRSILLPHVIPPAIAGRVLAPALRLTAAPGTSVQL